MATIILNSINLHKFTIILLHGMYQSNNDLIELSRNIQENNKNIKIILPNAPLRNIHWPNGIEKNIHSWYNYYTRRDGELIHDIININDFNNQIYNINKVIKKEVEILKNSKNIIIGGISQGGTLALYYGLTSKFILGGIIGIHTVLLDNLIKKYEKLNNIPLHLFSGNDDEIYNIKLQKKSLKNLKDLNYNINWEIINKLKHCEYSEKEYLFVNNSIKNILFV